MDDKPWGSTLREKVPRSVRLRYVNWGSKECQQGAGPIQGLRPVLTSFKRLCLLCANDSPLRSTKRDRRFGTFLDEDPAKKMCTVLADWGLA